MARAVVVFTVNLKSTDENNFPGISTERVLLSVDGRFVACCLLTELPTLPPADANVELFKLV